MALQFLETLSVNRIRQSILICGQRTLCALTDCRSTRVRWSKDSRIMDRTISMVTLVRAFTGFMNGHPVKRSSIRTSGYGLASPSFCSWPPGVHLCIPVVTTAGAVTAYYGLHTTNERVELYTSTTVAITECCVTE